MPFLKYIVQNATSTELRLLRGKTIECISLIGLAVGREKVSICSVTWKAMVFIYPMFLVACKFGMSFSGTVECSFSLSIAVPHRLWRGNAAFIKNTN